MPWTAIGLVSGGVTLTAFLAATAAWIYRQKLLADSKEIQSAPRSERSRIILARYGYVVQPNLDKLKGTEIAEIVQKQLGINAMKIKVVAIVIVLICLMTAFITCFALTADSRNVELKTRLEERNIQIAEIQHDQATLKNLLDKQIRISHELVGGVEGIASANESNPSVDVREVVAALQSRIERYRAEFGDKNQTREEKLALELANSTIRIYELQVDTTGLRKLLEARQSEHEAAEAFMNQKEEQGS